MSNVLYPLHTFEYKIIVAVCVYNRYDNIVEWLRCWEVCDHNGAELVIIHNHYNNQAEIEKFKTLCDKHNINYVPCGNIGFDIGRFQDVVKDRLKGFPNWSKLLWCCDDTLPMSKDFVLQFDSKLIGKVGVVCTDLSPHVRTHIRTTGFYISKETAEKLTFEVDPITTKEDCYRFEHREPVNYFYKQIINMGLKVVQVETREKSPLWDSGYHRRLKRQAEHNKAFPVTTQSDKITFICPVFNMYPQIISSLICQTYKNWELILIHNGPNVNGLSEVVKNYNEPRVKFIINSEETGYYGHPLRQWALQQDFLNDAGYVVISNADNYHTPTYCEYMLEGFKKNPGAYAVYCSEMVHSYKAWQVIPCRLQRGFIDCAGVMVKKEIAKEVGWRDIKSHSSDWTYFQDIITKYGAERWAKVKGALLVHN